MEHSDREGEECIDPECGYCCAFFECFEPRKRGDDLCPGHAAERNNAFATRPKFFVDLETDLREAGRL